MSCFKFSSSTALDTNRETVLISTVPVLIIPRSTFFVLTSQFRNDIKTPQG